MADLLKEIEAQIAGAKATTAKQNVVMALSCAAEPTRETEMPTLRQVRYAQPP